MRSCEPADLENEVAAAIARADVAGIAAAACRLARAGHPSEAAETWAHENAESLQRWADGYDLEALAEDFATQGLDGARETALRADLALAAVAWAGGRRRADELAKLLAALVEVSPAFWREAVGAEPPLGPNDPARPLWRAIAGVGRAIERADPPASEASMGQTPPLPPALAMGVVESLELSSLRWEEELPPWRRLPMGAGASLDGDRAVLVVPERVELAAVVWRDQLLEPEFSLGETRVYRLMTGQLQLVGVHRSATIEVTGRAPPPPEIQRFLGEDWDRLAPLVSSEEPENAWRIWSALKRGAAMMARSDWTAVRRRDAMSLAIL